MKVYESGSQELKCKIISYAAKYMWDGHSINDIEGLLKYIIQQGGCIRDDNEKEIKMLKERIKIACGINDKDEFIIEELKDACNKCKTQGYTVTDLCQGCIAQRCKNACARDAITFDKVTHKAIIDKSKCVECGMCSQACQYEAIKKFKRPCQTACKADAMKYDSDGYMQIDREKCVSCGSCVRACPFGAILDKSYVLKVIDYIMNSNNGKKYKVYAIPAPAILSQFTQAKPGQVMTAIKNLGFDDVIEVSQSADMVALLESKEISEKGFTISSCCPAFVSYTRKNFADLAHYISHTPSPMIQMAKEIKHKDPTAKVVFVGPCIAKKYEYQNSNGIIDAVITFEELQAMFESKNIDVVKCENKIYNDGSYYGRIFAVSGGVSRAAVEALKEQKIDFTIKPELGNGLESCKAALLKKRNGLLPEDVNFIEGMSCVGGCVNGQGCLKHIKTNAIIQEKNSSLSNKTMIDNMPTIK